MLLDRHDCILSDLDGVVYAGPFALEGAPEALNRAQDMGVPVAFVTNNASRSVSTVAEHLVKLGVKTDSEHVISSAQAAAEMLKDQVAPGAKVLICGAQALADCVKDAGFEPVWKQNDSPSAVVQGFNPELRWVDLAEAAFTLSDPDIVWVASNTDLTIPKERGIAPGNGTLVNAVATATGRTPLVAGKPESAIFTTGAKKLKSSQALVVGDRLDTDIQGGNRAQMATACVLTGVDTVESVLAAIPLERPTYLLKNLGELFEDYPDIEVSIETNGAQASCATHRALVTGNKLAVSGDSDHLNFWRVSCAAWWAAHPHVDVPTSPEEIVHEQ